MATTLYFPVTYKRGTHDYLGWITCISGVAEFLGFIDKGKTLAEAFALAKIEVKGHTRKSRHPSTGVLKDVTVDDFKRLASVPDRDGGKIIRLKTGEAVGKSKRSLHLRASPSMPNIAIMDGLGELIPDTKVSREAAPGANEVSAIVQVGASRYLLPKQEAATGTATPDIPDALEQFLTAIGLQKGKPKPTP